MTFGKGWTAEHSDPEALKRIAQGVCREIDKEARARRSGVITKECVGKRMNDAKAAWKEQNRQNTNTKK